MPSPRLELRTTQGAPFPQRQRPKYSRTTSGCLTCRRRRKKCDRLRPDCVACQRNKLQCNWPETQRSTDSRLVTSVSTTSIASSSIMPYPYIGTAPTSIPRPLGFADVDDTLLLTRWSMLLYDHYVTRTSINLCTLSPQYNAFRTYVVESATSDSVLLHSLLAVSGTHLDFKDAAALEVKQTTFAHYRAALRGIRREINVVLSSPQDSCLRLALILLVVCHAEVIGGSPRGEIFPHLAAARQIIMIHRQSGRVNTETDEVLQGLVLETYAYLVLVSNITPYGTMMSRTIPLDDFVVKLDHLPRYTTFGSFFSCGYDVFEYIPKIAILAKQCLDEIAMSGSCSTASKQTYAQLLNELSNLGSCTVVRGAAEEDTQSAREIYRRSLLIFLETAIAGPVVDNVESRRVIQQHVNAVFPHSQEVRETNFGTIMLWPLMVVASCLISEDQRNRIRRRAELPHRWLTNQLPAAQRILEMLWASDDRSAFGPYGLFMIMQQHDINYSMA